jgi:hypothetical protein
MFEEFVRGDRDDMIGVEHRVICRDGSVRRLQSNSRVLPERGVVFAVARDVTDRRRADAELRDAHQMIEASRDELARLAEEQAALRRVATLVARGVPPEGAFAAVATDVGRLLLGDVVNLSRYESDGAFTLVASAGNHFPVGRRWPHGGKNLGTLVFDTAVLRGSTTMAMPPARWPMTSTRGASARLSRRRSSSRVACGA